MTDSAGLDRIADTDGRLAVLAMDQRGTLRRMLDGAGRPSTVTDLSTFKIDVVAALSPLSSGVLLDAEYGVGPVRAAGAMPPGVGLLVAAEPEQRDSWNGEPRVRAVPERGAAWVREQTGDAVKFLIQWCPDRVVVDGEPDLAAEAAAAVAVVVADCAAQGLPSVIEPLVVGDRGESLSAARKQALVLGSASRLATRGPSLLKLEWPGGSRECEKVTAALGRVPWALLSAGVAYEEFTERVRIALDAGASGVIAGRAIWGEAVGLIGQARHDFLREVARPRMAGLLDVLAGRGRSWREVAA
jgi:tagatose-1,6-bisphosphate aldolase